MAPPSAADGAMPVDDYGDYSPIDKPRLFSSSFPVPEKLTASCNLITFLAVAQRLQIPFLPITWQPKRPLVGRGGTSQIHQALVNLQTSFVFKRVGDEEKLEELEKEILRRLINEITTLRHPTIRDHPGILELQGICWDIPPKKSQNDTEVTPPRCSNNEVVFPVLVFEKSQFGDLYHFARLPIGRELGISERLKICLDIGSAITHMQSNHIIHGDIKPQNVLIFKGDGGSFTAKVADFGFSTQSAHDNYRMKLPRSRPWYAPEIDEYPKFSPQQAAKAEAFSFGMLCLWFMFEKYLSGALPLPEAAHPARSSYTGKDRSLQFLADLKKKDSLAQLASQLVMAEAGLNAESRLILEQFFKGCLARDPKSRDVDIQYLLKNMKMHETQPIASTSSTVAEIVSPIDHDFNLCRSLYSFYSSDYRLRSRIVECLEEIVASHSASPLSAQLALCYELGFGCPGGSGQLGPLVYDREGMQDQLKEAMDLELAIRGNAGTLYNALADMGHHSSLIFLGDYYREHNVLETAESITRREVESARDALGVEHPIVSLLNSILSSIAYVQGRLREAEELFVQVMEMRKRVLGEEHLHTLTTMANLASTYRNQGRWKEAEVLEVQVVEAFKSMLGKEHPSTLISMESLAKTYMNQGRWKKTEELEVQVMEVRKRVLSEEHPHTLVGMANLAVTYRNQGRWKEAEDLEVQVMETSLRVLGIEHPETPTSMDNLASTYRHQGRWKEAEKLEAQAMETRMRVLGAEHPDTLTSKHNLSVTYKHQGRWKEAEELDVQVMETSLRVLGEEHPDTLRSMDGLAATYRNQGRWKEAEELEVQVMETRKRVLGKEHPDTLTSVNNLASTFWNQGRWKEAEELEVQVVETRKRVLGEEHPNTLTSINNLALTLWNRGQRKEAEELQVQVMETRKRVLGGEHPDTLSSMADLASTFWNQGRWREAEELQMPVMEARRSVLGDEHPDTLTSMNNLASTYRNQKRWKEAEDLFAQAMKMSMRVLGKGHPDTLASMGNLASTFYIQGRWREAEELAAQVVEIRKRVLGEEHPDTLTSMNNLAIIWKGQGRGAEALKLMEECIELQTRVLGVDHPHTLSSSARWNRWKAERLEVDSSAAKVAVDNTRN